MSMIHTDRTDELVDRLFNATIGTLELFSIHIGTELGLYRELHESGPLTQAELSERAGIAERYAQEWLEQQAVAGYVEVHDAGAAPAERLYSLSADQARVLVSPDDPAHVAPFAPMLAGIGRILDKVVDAYRTGGGVPYTEYGTAFRHGQGHINRPAFTADLPDVWVKALPDVLERLEAGTARVADVGSGQGWASIGMARAFPGIRVDGYDLDAASVADARRFAAEAALDGRVRFFESDVADSAGEGPYDLVLVLEVLHDLARPVEALRAIRETLAPGGAVLVADERVADEFTAPGDETERIMYGWSIVHCLPTQLTESPSAALGTVIRASTVRELAREAGYSAVRVLDVENDFFRLYRLDA
jgi:2-polyprenyl-3-methyl-5-hydroxy-6-metoxy-1,4-benzoquinol methylase